MPKKIKERKGKRERKKHPKHLKSTLYGSAGEKAERKARFCPKCGPGTFMATHKDRVTCGKCSYTELKNSAKKAAEN
ncbi:MAG: 30S ribosomal protein S27ae [Candidatus Diapherotrites archaeon]|uniref:Small ribosomal subunit protein eS31 n=1 Tax=Candidatus Iainarchaeum sp. TaxID=3101447 RepID=A0A938YP14_9ARCH|nr:30S ribosomal protein S27ae [Candidatus Diapherotrites archaeon]